MTKFPKIMGIVNVTPDSFSDGGRFFSKKKALEHSLKLIEDGADIIDIGGESTRPGAEPVSIDEELNRVIPLINEIKNLKPNCVISIDTSKAIVAEQAAIAGVKYINDITALGNDIEIAKIASKYNCGLILMHIQGTPRTMQTKPTYNDVVTDVFSYFEERISIAKKYNVKEIIADVGIGFGKTVMHNLELIKNLDYFHILKVPLMLGISRKSFIGKLFNIDNPIDRDSHTALFHSLILSKNLDIIRVHNVKVLSDLKKINKLVN